jgi:hypothetical protein
LERIDASAPRSRPAPAPSRLATALWWAATIATLVVLDDLLFGPFFWAAAVRWGPWVAATLIVVTYVPAQVLLVRQSMSDVPVALARFVLRRLDLDGGHSAVRRNESTLRHHVVGATSALAMSLVLGGVIPCIVLSKRGYDRRFVCRLSVATSIVYAAEFAILHGVLPGLIAK